MSPNQQDSNVFHQKLAEFDVPEHLWAGLWGYYNIGQPVGSFLEAVLCNDLRGACRRADSNSRAGLFNVVGFLWNVYPHNIWGSVENVAKWLAVNGRPAHAAQVSA